MLLSSSDTVKELVVSAGDNLQVTLPKNEVELNAFVVPPPRTGEFNNLFKQGDIKY